MNNLILVGKRQATQKYIDSFIKDNNFAPYEVNLFSEKIKIEHSRFIQKKLSFKHQGKLLFVFCEEVTIEAQNALLKSIEEHADNIFFIFCVEKEDLLLSTISSRCLIKHLASEEYEDTKLQHLTESLFENGSWKDMDMLLDYMADKPIDTLLPIMRSLIVTNYDNSKKVSAYYTFCKKLLVLLPLSEFNNVNKKVVIENAFFY